MFQAEEEHMQRLRGKCKAKLSMDERGVQGRRVHRGGRSEGPRRPQEELWTGMKQEWDEVGGWGRGCSRNSWETWQLALGFGHREAENRTDCRAPWKAELAGGDHQGAEEVGVKAEPLPLGVGRPFTTGSTIRGETESAVLLGHPRGERQTGSPGPDLRRGA